jgi:hypothetical protein
MFCLAEERRGLRPRGAQRAMRTKNSLGAFAERYGVEKVQAGEGMIGKLVKGDAMEPPWPTINDSIQGVMTTLFATEPLTGDAGFRRHFRILLPKAISTMHRCHALSSSPSQYYGKSDRFQFPSGGKEPDFYPLVEGGSDTSQHRQRVPLIVAIFKPTDG